jgi:hypothetical protein
MTHDGGSLQAMKPRARVLGNVIHGTSPSDAAKAFNLLLERRCPGLIVQRFQAEQTTTHQLQQKPLLSWPGTATQVYSYDVISIFQSNGCNLIRAKILLIYWPSLMRRA